MRLRDSRVRRVAEHALHVVAALAVIAMTWIAVRMLSERPAAMAAGTEVPNAVARWSTSESPQRAHVAFTEVPAPQLRDWIGALRGADTAITWEGESLAPSGLVVEPVPDPKHPARIWVAAAPGTTIVIRDNLGTLASVRSATAGSGGVAVTAPRVEGTVRARVGNSEAIAEISDTLTIKPVLILGAAGWEGKFVMASLEEYGWKVDGRFRLSAKEFVIQGSSSPKIDTEHYSAVIALDATASRYARAIEQYVRAGGGLIAIGEAAALPVFASLLGARAGEPSDEKEFTQASATVRAAPRSALSLTPLSNLKDDAVPLERGPGDAVAAVARRVGDGRVLQVGYRDTWRWRMAGTDENPVTAYRNWWSAMVSSVAHATGTPRPVSDVVEPTPLATLISTLGPATSAQTDGALSGLLDPRMLKWLFALALGALLLEWASRRLRGAP